MDAQVRVEGLPQLRRTFRKLEADTADLKDANAAAAAMVASAASARAPRRTGALASSTRGNRALSRATVSAGGAALPYAGPIHWGWPSRGIAGQPFIVDAAQATEAAWLPVYQAGLEKAVDNATAMAL